MKRKILILTMFVILFVVGCGKNTNHDVKKYINDMLKLECYDIVDYEEIKVNDNNNIVCGLWFINTEDIKFHVAESYNKELKYKYSLSNDYKDVLFKMKYDEYGKFKYCELDEKYIDYSEKLLSCKLNIHICNETDFELAYNELTNFIDFIGNDGIFNYITCDFIYEKEEQENNEEEANNIIHCTKSLYHINQYARKQIHDELFP